MWKVGEYGDLGDRGDDSIGEERRGEKIGNDGGCVFDAVEKGDDEGNSPGSSAVAGSEG